MNSNSFEKTYSDFIGRRENDHAESVLFEIVHIAIKAGWLAAGGETPQPQEVFRILNKENPPPGET